MSLLSQLLGAAGRVFSPPSLYVARSDSDDWEPGRIEGARVSASLVALGAKMAKADGLVRADDIAAFNRVFKFAPGDAAAIAKLFNLAAQTTLGADYYAGRIARKFRAQPAALEDVLDGLFHIALADGVVTDEEEAFLQGVSERFGFSHREFRRIRASHLGPDENDPYLILGVDPDIDDASLKRAYRRMAAMNHPDRLLARGLPPQLQTLANHKMAIINAAYAKAREERAAKSRMTEMLRESA